jgi:hypothetical protein
MIPADELISIKLTFAEQCALVRTAPLEGAQPSRRSHNYDIEPLRRQRIWAIAVKLKPDWQHGSAKPSSLAVLRGIRDAGEHVRNTAESVKQICHSSGKIDEVNYTNRHDLTRYEQILAALDPAEVTWRASQL